VVLPTLAAAPVFSPPTGTYAAVQLLTMTDATPGAKIYYTTNGTTPTSGSTLYNTPIRVSASETVKAIAIAPGYTNSAVTSAAYTIVGTPSALAAPPTAIGISTATLSAIVDSNGLSGSYAFHYGISSSALNTITPATPLPASTTEVAASASISGLTTKTTYYYQVVVSTKGGTSSGAVLSFTTN